MMPLRSCLHSSALLLVLTASVAWAQKGSPSYGGDSPQAVVAAMQKAVKSDDLAAAIPFIAPAGRREVASEAISSMLLVLASKNPDDPLASGTPLPKTELAAKRKSYKATVDVFRKTLKPHGLDRAVGRPVMAPDTQAIVDTALAKADTVVLVRSLMALMDRVGPGLGMSRGDRPRVTFALGTVGSYKIEGERATARAGRETIEFQRLDARWYVRPMGLSGR